MKGRCFKLISSVILCIFMADICLAVPVTPSAEMPSSPPDSGFEQALVTDRYEGRSDRPTVFYIQDAHSLLPAQRAIQRSIDQIQQNRFVRAIALEGASSPLNTDLLRSYPARPELEKVLWTYAEKGEVSGAEIQAVLGPKTDFQGLEDPALYDEGRQAFQEAYQAREKAAPSFVSLESRLAELSRQAFVPGLNKLLDLQRAFRTEALSLPAFLEHLKSLGLAPSETYPELSRMLELLEGEEKLEKDLGVQGKVKAWIEAQWRDPKTAVIRQAYATSQLTLGDAVRKVIESRGEGTLSESERELLEPVATAGEFEQISGPLVMSELDSWIRGKEDEGVRESDQGADLLAAIRDLELLKKLLALELSREEWQEAASKQDLLRPQRFQGFFKNSGAPVPLAWDLAPSLRFYEITVKRDEAFFRNFESLAAGHRDPKSTFIVVAGGFHAEAFARSLKEKGYSYAVLQPLFGWQGESPYARVMMGEASYLSSSMSVPVTLESRSPYRERMLRNMGRDLLPAGDERASGRMALRWENDLLEDWRSGETAPDIASSLKVLKDIAVTGSSLGEAGDKEGGLAPGTLYTQNALQDAFNYLFTILSNPAFGGGRTMAFFMDTMKPETEKSRGFIFGRVGLERRLFMESGIYTSGKKVETFPEELRETFQKWKDRGQGNLYPYEIMVKNFNFDVVADANLVTEAVKTRKAQHWSADQDPSDRFLLKFEVNDIKVPSEYYVLPIVHGDDVLGVVYIDNFNSELVELQRIPPEAIEGLKASLKDLGASLDIARLLGKQRYELTRDKSTGVLAQRGISEKFEVILEKTLRNEQEITLVVGDADNLKRVNDTFGHDAGDAYIRLIFEKLREVEKHDVIVGRPYTTGDESVMIFQGRDMKVVWPVLARIRREVAQTKWERIVGVPVTDGSTPSVSMGATVHKAYRISDKHFAFIPFYHHDRAARIRAQIRSDYDQLVNAGQPLPLGERTVALEGEDFGYFLFEDDPQDPQILRRQVAQLHNRVYEVISKEADHALLVSKEIKREEEKERKRDAAAGVVRTEEQDKKHNITTYSLEVRGHINKLQNVQKKLETELEKALETVGVTKEDLKKLRESHDYEFHMSSYASHKIDRDGVILDVSNKWQDLLGYTREEVRGQPIFSFISEEGRVDAIQNHFERMYPDDKDPKKAAINRGLRSAKITELLMNYGLDPLTAISKRRQKNAYLARAYVRKDGKQVTVTSTHEVQMDGDDIRGMKTDLQGANQIRYLRDRAQLSGLDELAFGDDGLIFYASRRLGARLGYKNADWMIGNHILDLFPVEEREKVLRLMDPVKKVGEVKGVKILGKDGQTIEVSIRRANTVYEGVETLVFTLVGGSTSGKSLGSQGSLDIEELHALADWTGQGLFLKPRAWGAPDLAARRILSVTGVAPEELERRASEYLKERGISPLFFGPALPSPAPSFLVLDLSSLITQDETALARMAELVSERGRIFPVYTDREAFTRFRGLMTQLTPELRARFLQARPVTKLTPGRIASLRKVSRLEDASLSFLVSRPDILEGDFSRLVPEGKEALAFQFAAQENDLTLGKTVYSIAFSAFLHGSGELVRIDPALLAKDEKSGLAYFSFDVNALAAALMADRQAELAILRAA